MKKLLGLCLFLFGLMKVGAQDVTLVKGTVFDKETGEPLPFVDVSFLGTSVGTSTDLDGIFQINTRFPSDTLVVNFLGYEDFRLYVESGTKQRNLRIELVEQSLKLDEVKIVAKKGRYRRKNNPAVDLMKKVIANKKQNRLEGQPYYKHRQHEKIEVDINNITEEFQDRRLMKPFKIIFDYMDTSDVNGKTFLPFFMQEIDSEIHYRQSPQSKKEIRKGINVTQFDKDMDMESIVDVVSLLYQDVNIYNSTIDLLGNEFISPLADRGILFYRYYIADTLDVNGINSIQLNFIPRNQANFGFTGAIYVSNDDQHFMVKADLTITRNIHLNFVNDLKLVQEFEPLGEAMVLTKDKIAIDYSPAKNGIGFFGIRTVSYDDFDFDKPEDEDVFNGLEKVIIEKGAYERDNNYWLENRIDPLSEQEEGIYEMLDTLKGLRAYKNFVGLTKIVLTGFVPAGPVDIGTLATFYSFNSVEGSRPKLGFESNFKFSKKWFLEGSLAYGFRDKQFKYMGGVTYTFNQDYKENPRHYLRLGVERAATFPGLDLNFVNENNVFLSFRRGVADRMILFRDYDLNYILEGKSFAFNAFINKREEDPYGTLVWQRTNDEGQQEFLNEIKLGIVGLGIEFAPNKQFIQGRQYRTPIINKHPIFSLRYKGHFKGFLDGEYNFHKVEGSIFKRFDLSVFGHTNMIIEGATTFGEGVYTSLYIPNANQTFAYQKFAYNLMNFIEFGADSYYALNIEHFFKGFIFNKIPLWKKLKLREIVTMKMYHGFYRNDLNNPTLNPNVPQFSVDADGVPLTYAFKSNVPYIEAGFGISNIFKFLRVDAIKRMTYLDHPNIQKVFGVKGLGLRFRVKFEF